MIVLVGPEEIPFGIQKDLLCAQSPYYREEFSKGGEENKVEHVVKLPEVSVDTFGCFQSFIYTGEVYDKRIGMETPDYGVLLRVWSLATKLRMAPLRMQVMNTMYERRMMTRHVPGPELLIEAWKQTDNCSALRKMLLNWAAENMRDVAEFRPQYAKALPQEILAELVIIMSDPASIPVFPTHPQAPQPPPLHTNGIMDVAEDHPKSAKRPRKSEPTIGVPNGDDNYEAKPIIKKVRKSTGGDYPLVRKPPRKSSLANGFASPSHNTIMTPEKELDFCRDLIQRMLSGPGFWTRLVGPFKKPVDPVTDKVPKYFDVVKKPMDLTTIKTKMNNGQYSSAPEFEADVKQIFQNCYEYWTQDDPIFKLCEQFEKYFHEKWNLRHKWQPSVKMEIE